MHWLYFCRSYRSKKGLSIQRRDHTSWKDATRLMCKIWFDLFSYTKSKVFSPAIMKSVTGLSLLFISHVANIRVACSYVYGCSFHDGPWDVPQWIFWRQLMWFYIVDQLRGKYVISVTNLRPQIVKTVSFFCYHWFFPPIVMKSVLYFRWFFFLPNFHQWHRWHWIEPNRASAFS